MSPRESNPDHSVVRLRGPDAIVEATEAARRFGRSLCLADDDLARLCIIVEELIANLYDHGGLTDQDGVELALVREAAATRVIIADTGRPFDPRTPPASSEQPGPGGGAGLALVHTWSEIVSYDTTSSGNRLELLVPLQSCK